ncbi:MAG: TolC family protein [Thermodesulfobacteriota bacterium]
MSVQFPTRISGLFQAAPLAGFFAAFVLFLSPVPAGANTLSLEDAEQWAVEASLEIRLAGTDVRINKGFQKEATAAYMPKLSSRLIPPFVGRESGFFADQILWDFGRTRNRVRSRKSLVDMARLSKKDASNEAVRQARKAFYKVLLEEARLLYTEKESQLAEMQLERSRILEKNGRISSLELARQESDAQSVLFEKQTVSGNVSRARFELFQLIGKEDVGASLEVPAYDEDAGFVSAEEVLPVIFRANPRLLSLAERLKSDRANISAARAEFLPVIYGRVAYRFKGEGAQTPAFIAGAGAKLPIFEGLSRFGRLDRMKAARERTEIRIEIEKQRLERDVRRLMMELSHADASIELSRQILENAKEKLILAREKEQLGAASKLDLVFSEKEYSKFYFKYEESLYNRRVVIVDLKFLADETPVRGS